MRELAERFRALGEPTRLKILRLLHERELCVCEIAEALQMSQPRVSQHLKVLRLAGLVDERKVRVWSYYALVPGALDRLFGEFREIMQRKMALIPELAEEADRLSDIENSPAIVQCKTRQDGSVKKT